VCLIVRSHRPMNSFCDCVLWLPVLFSSFLLRNGGTVHDQHVRRTHQLLHNWSAVHDDVRASLLFAACLHQHRSAKVSQHFSTTFESTIIFSKLALFLFYSGIILPLPTTQLKPQFTTQRLPLTRPQLTPHRATITPLRLLSTNLF